MKIGNIINGIDNRMHKYINERRGFKTNRKIVVIESDDWGSIRMPSKEVYFKLLDYGIRVDNCHYNKYDSLASEEDLIALFETLVRFKDINNRNPIITANTIVANPDFIKIRKANFNKYYYEKFTETLYNYPAHKNAFNLWKEGISNKLFFPQFHGREHLNVNRWMKALQREFSETRLAFENSMFGISNTITKENRKSYMAALDLDDISELEEQKKIVEEGLNLFEKIFGFRSASFIAPNYIWHSSIEDTLSKSGVKYIQGCLYQKNPMQSGVIKKWHYLGERIRSGQLLLTRNCHFEPSGNNKIQHVNIALKQIEKAFLLKKPAIISSHRVNYVGFVVKRNRLANLQMLEELVTNILKKWPNVEFMTTTELGALINQEDK